MDDGSPICFLSRFALSPSLLKLSAKSLYARIIPSPHARFSGNNFRNLIFGEAPKIAVFGVISGDLCNILGKLSVFT